MKYYKSKTARFLAGKGFYPIVALCLIAVGVATWSAVSSLSTEPEADNNSSYTERVSSYTFSSKDEMTAQTVSDVEDERTSSKESSSAKPQTSSDTVSREEPQTPIASYFVMPIEGNIAKSFSLDSLQYSKTYSDMRIHNGIDIEAAEDSEIKSAGEGTVISVEKDVLWGTVIEIDHGNDITGIYCGLKNAKVKQGDVVHAGTLLGVLGIIPCESMDASHFHLSFKENETYISPLEVMDIAG